MAQQQVPSVGRVVHYVAYGTPGGEFPSGICRAAIITAIPDESHLVSLFILNPTGMFFNEEVRFSPNNEPGTWHWPEYVPPKQG